MSSIREVSLPTQEPVSVSEAQDFLKIPRTQDSSMIAGLITAARVYAEAVTSRALANRKWVMTLDFFPYYVDSVISQQLASSMVQSLPRYTTTAWNYSQQIKLWKAPVTKVERITYIGTDGFPHDLFPGTDFVVDYGSEDCRLFTKPGGFWPPVLFVVNSVQIFFEAGYDADPTKILTIGATDDDQSVPASLPTPPNQQASITLAVGVPETVRTALMMLVANWYFNRESVVAGSVGSVPNHIDALLASQIVWDFSPTRG